MAYLYCVSWALKALVGQGPTPRKATKWQGKIREEWAQGQFKTNSLNLKLDQAIERLDFNSLNRVSVAVKSTHSKGT